MMKYLRLGAAILLCFCLSTEAWSLSMLQICNIPIIDQFFNHQPNSVDAEWNDFNNDISYWELEIVPKGNNPTGVATYSFINQTNYTIPGLLPASSYSLYLRAICPIGISDWNGPFQFNTSIDAANSCDLSFPITDDSCPNTDPFYFDNKIEGRLGFDLFIESVDLVVDHSWPSDLSLELVAPDGSRRKLISNLGINSQHLGDPDQPCDQSLSFSDLACVSILDSEFPIRGAYQPEEFFSGFYNGSEGLGNWTLEICDRAEGDIGTLKQFKINFSVGTCHPPGEIFVTKIAGTFIEIQWDSPSCEELEIIYGPEGFLPSEATVRYVDCGDQFFRILDLMPDTQYEFFFNTVCLDKTFEAGCAERVLTTCANPSLDMTFDALADCEESCDSECNLQSNFWNNIGSDDLEWIVNIGSTPTAFTGPDTDLKGGGKYIYVDANSTSCGPFLQATIESTCILVKSNASACDLSFFYAMNGVDVGTLEFLISADNGENYQTLWSSAGDQGRDWQQALIDLSAYDETLVKFRLTATTGDGNFGDIAIDEIKLYSSLFADQLDQYYLDEDGDGFGNIDAPLSYCAMTAPTGYVKTPGDCNDQDPNINPGVVENPCNQKDDNCDGQSDDINGSNIAVTEEIESATCDGQPTGKILLEVTGGIGPYTYDWNVGATVEDLIIANAGIYQCTITDQAGCVFITPEYVVEADQLISFTINQLTDLDCNSGIFGSIGVLAGGGTGPYSYAWNNGETTSSISNLQAGNYQVTINDSSGCQLVSDTIEISEIESINTGVVLKSDVDCANDANGSLLIASNGGLSPYSYSWNTGQVGNPINDLDVGTYIYTVTDSNGCTQVSDSIHIVQNEALWVRLDVIENNLCQSENEGYILTTPQGGVPPYIFSWSNGETADDIINLNNGAYNLTITDSNGCTASRNDILISSPASIQVEISSLVEETCQSGLDGYIGLIVTGGVGNYRYNWSHGSDHLPYLDSLSAGLYSVTIIDDFGCKKSLNNIPVGQNSVELPVTLSVDQELECFADTNAIVTVSTNDGSFPYTYNWSSGDQASGDFFHHTVENLSAGNYTVTVTDGNGCTGISEFLNLVNPQALGYTQEIINASANGDPGMVTVFPMGGTEPYFLEYDTASEAGPFTDSIAVNLSPGVYPFSLTDSNGCEIQWTTLIDLLESNAELELLGVTIYPTPSHEFLQIKTNQLTLQGYALIDAQGKIVLKETSNLEVNPSLDLSTLNSGIYILQLNIQGQMYLTKVIKI